MFTCEVTAHCRTDVCLYTLITEYFNSYVVCRQLSLSDEEGPSPCFNTFLPSPLSLPLSAPMLHPPNMFCAVSVDSSMQVRVLSTPQHPSMVGRPWHENPQALKCSMYYFDAVSFYLRFVVSLLSVVSS